MDLTALLATAGAGSQVASVILLTYLVLTVRKLDKWADEHTVTDRKVALTVAKIAGKIGMDMED